MTSPISSSQENCVLLYPQNNQQTHEFIQLLQRHIPIRIPCFCLSFATAHFYMSLSTALSMSIPNDDAEVTRLAAYDVGPGRSF